MQSSEEALTAIQRNKVLPLLWATSIKMIYVAASLDISLLATKYKNLLKHSDQLTKMIIESTVLFCFSRIFIFTHF